MESEMEKKSGSADIEDNLPSDFFDDFNKEDFMDGLSVIDTWNADDHKSSKIDTEKLDKYEDLRDLIRDSKQDDRNKRSLSINDKRDHYKNAKERKLDELIKPGSRRDPNKTNEAIKRDKEVKVKEYLAKHLEASDEIRPPGTELDDFFAESHSKERKKTPIELHQLRRPKEYQENRRESPPRENWQHRRSPRRSPRHSSRRSPPRGSRRSPRRPYHRPTAHSPGRFQRRCSPRRSPYHKYSRHHSRSPVSTNMRRSFNSRRSPSPFTQQSENIPYGQNTFNIQPAPYHNYPPAQPYPGGYSAGGHEYPYTQDQQYGGYMVPGYDYGVQSDIHTIMPVPQPVPAPIMDSIPVHEGDLASPKAPPAMVPPPDQMVSPSHSMDSKNPHDALAKLFAEGKLSKEDYMKLAPNKGVGNIMDPYKVLVLNRCQEALGKLSKLLLPNRLLMNNNMLGHETKCITPKYCSPLKRQATVDFHFTKVNATDVQQNKQLVDSIVSTIGLDNVVNRPKKKSPKDMKDVGVQTTRPYCDVCEIREATSRFETSTYTEPEYFTSSIHTQVVDEDLINSKSIFNPTGSASDGAPISIAHLTPAQLVSQLAARAKTLKQTPEPMHPMSNQFGRRNPPNTYDNRGSHYHNNFNYRY